MKKSMVWLVIVLALIVSAILSASRAQGPGGQQWLVAARKSYYATVHSKKSSFQEGV